MYLFTSFTGETRETTREEVIGMILDTFGAFMLETGITYQELPTAAASIADGIGKEHKEFKGKTGIITLTQ